MSDIILHHYQGSPFAQKIRSILGVKQLSWRSVLIPEIMPKPDVIALTGGYRRTPIMQMGAHIYCDTVLISKVLDGLSTHAPLYPACQLGSANMISNWADSVIFQHAVSLILNPAILIAMFDHDEAKMKAFVADRMVMGKDSPRRQVSGEEAHVFFDHLLPNLNEQFSGCGPFVLGDTVSIADFSVYHSLWFIKHKPVLKEKFEGLNALNDWLARVSAFGEGDYTELSSGQAIEIANDSTVGSIEQKNILKKFALGDEVTVTPGDYAFDPVIGRLVYSDRHEVVVIRTDERAGEVAVHFPRLGYDVQNA